MRFVLDVAGSRREVELTRHTSTATLADLLVAGGAARPEPDAAVWVADVRREASDLLDDVGLMEGDTVSDAATPAVEPLSGWVAVHACGLDAGGAVPVPTTRPLVVGRAPHADLTLTSLSASWMHLTIQREGEGVRIKDAGSTNGTLVNGEAVDEEGVLVEDDAVVIAGGAAITVRQGLRESPAPRPGSLHNLTPAGTAPFNRPPLPGRPPAAEPVVPPKRKDIQPTSKFSFLTILAPLVMAFAMVMLTGQLQYALISALSPLLGVGTWLEQKHRRTREIAEEDKRFTESLETLRKDLAKAAVVERSRRREDQPDPAITLRRAEIPTVQLWQRRPHTPGFLTLNGGVGDVPWTPPVDSQGSGRLDDEVREVINASQLISAPVEVDLTDAGVVGIVGDREGALAVARSLVTQATVHCGPADLTVVVCCDPGRDEAWSWTTWLPHARRVGDGSGDRWVSAERSRSEALLRGLRDGIDNHPTPTVLLVIDSDVLTEGRESPARTLLGRGRPVGSSGLDQKRPTQVSGVVIASSEEQLPAACTVVITVGEDAAGQVTRPLELSRVEDVVLAGIDVPTAERGAIALARFDDPELIVPGAALPSLVRLPPLLGVDELTPEVITHLWSTSRGISTPIGIGEKGGFGLDLVKDGPHGLVGGTTGSGKSEFLRSLVAGLAARNDPTKLTFILIDFKGGAAFKTCERLPHTIGTVSNLDAQLADRAIRALEAEMEYRQRMFAAAGEGIDNLDAYLRTNPAEPMPRLLLVIDEFAMLAKDHPDVLRSLVSVGAVGRTLGVHMILATQRPAGVVNEDILANTNLRVALRVQSRDDSSNVIGVPTASAIGRNQQGRAFVKLGQDDITPVQTALVTGRAEASEQAPVDVREITFGPPPKAAKAVLRPETDLDLLIDCVIAANDAAGIAPPRKVWPEPLGERVELAGFTPSESVEAGKALPVVGGVEGNTVMFGLADEPDQQRQIGVGWDLERGNLLLMGIPGSGTSTALSSMALTLAMHFRPEDLDLLVLDLGSRDLAPLGDLPHCVAYVGSGSAAREQQIRLLKWARAELDRRRTTPGPHRRTVVLIDGLAALRDEYTDFEGLELLSGLYRAYADGPEVGLWFATATSRAKAIPGAMEEVTTQKWLFRLADAYDYAASGIRPAEAPAHVAGRCVLAETHLQTHVATPGQPLAAAVAEVSARWGQPARKADVVGQLPESVSVTELGATAALTHEPTRIPVGIRESDLSVGYLELYEGEHALIAGPARSGKSTTLLALAEAVKTGDSGGVPVQLWAVGNRRSPLGASTLFDRVATGPEDIPALVAAARMQKGRVVVMIDDAERLEDSDASISGLIAANLPGLHLIVAGRSDDLRTMYSHWTKLVRKSRSGLLLLPNPDYDGELLGAAVPRKPPVAMSPGRGYLCTGGASSFVQCASPSGLQPTLSVVPSFPRTG